MPIPSDLRAALGPIGVWCAFDAVPVTEVIRFAGLVEELGYGALWINESIGREPFAVLGALSRTTTTITLGLGIATIYARDAAAAHAGARTIADLSGGRFVMGLGVSHRSSAGARGHDYLPPLAAMTSYLDAYDAAPWGGPPMDDPPLVLAALGPRMLGLAATRAAGAFPYLVTTTHVAAARRILDEAAAGAETPASEERPARPVLVASLLAVLGSGPEVMAAARAAVSRYVGQPNYRANLLRGGIAEEEIEGLADTVVDALVATGDGTALRGRVAAMHDAGADHVAVIPLSAAGRPADEATTRALAPG